MKTLKQVSEMVGMSRRVIQEYEKAGTAIKPKNRSDHGYLRYDEEEVERLWQIRFYRELGYSKRKIKTIFDDPTFDKRKALEMQIELLIKKKEELDFLIDTAKELKDIGISPIAMRFDVQWTKDIPYDLFYPMLREMFSTFNQEDVEPDFSEIITDSDIEALFEAVEKIISFSDKDLAFSSEEVQNEIKKIHTFISNVLSDSISLFSTVSTLFAAGGEGAYDIDEEFGKGKSEYFYNALQHYCQNHLDNDTDREINEILDNIFQLGRKRYTADSEAVQAEVAKLYNFFCGIKILPESERLNMLKKTGELYDSKVCKQIVDNGKERGKSWFLSKAIQIYCKRLE